MLEVCRYDFDRAMAAQLLDPETLGRLLTASTTVQLQVK
jgi:hypothetical protein